MTEIAVSKQPNKKKIRVRNNQNYGYEMNENYGYETAKVRNDCLPSKRFTIISVCSTRFISTSKQ